MTMKIKAAVLITIGCTLPLVLFYFYISSWITTSVTGNLRVEVESNSCRAIKLKYSKLSITNDTLVEVYQTCNPGAENETIEFGPKLLDSVFGPGVFEENCTERDLRYNMGQLATFAALASVQGSGNTWSRILLEDMTGIYTGSIYRDGDSRSLQIGSRLCPLYNTIIVKTHRRRATIGHKCDGALLANFTHAIYLVRNPYTMTIAEFNRKNAGKVDVAPKEAFEGKAWDEWVTREARRWFVHVDHWLNNPIPVHVLVYEELTKNTLWELYKVAQFLDYPVDFHRMGCINYRADVQATYLRQKPDWLKPELLYSQKQKNNINGYITRHINGIARKYNVVKQFSSYILE